MPYSFRKLISSLLLLLPLSLLLLSLTACQEKGPAEKAGAKVDQAVEETKEDARQAKENVEDAIKK